MERRSEPPDKREVKSILNDSVGHNTSSGTVTDNYKKASVHSMDGYQDLRSKNFKNTLSSKKADNFERMHDDTMRENKKDL